MSGFSYNGDRDDYDGGPYSDDSSEGEIVVSDIEDNDTEKVGGYISEEIEFTAQEMKDLKLAKEKHEKALQNRKEYYQKNSEKILANALHMYDPAKKQKYYEENQEECRQRSTSRYKRLTPEQRFKLNESYRERRYKLKHGSLDGFERRELIDNKIIWHLN